MSAIKKRLEEDVKAAMLARDSVRLDTLRGLKSVILYAEVAAGKREAGLGDAEIEGLFAREAKKRQESADLYVKGGADEKAAKELVEKKIIEEYLPEQMSKEDIVVLVEGIIAKMGEVDQKSMGKVISEVKLAAGSSADGSVIAQIVKEKLS